MILTPEVRALLKRMDADDAIDRAAQLGWNAAIDAVVQAIEAMVESVGDAARYDKRDMTCCERERMYMARGAVDRALALKDSK